MKLHRFFLLFGLLLLTGALAAQSNSRSGFAAPQESRSQLRSFPCGGIEIAQEGFDADTIPAGWRVIDVDQLSPRTEIQGFFPQGGWQPILDFKDSSNHALASPSWYEGSTGPSDDWLISPQFTNLPADVCLSWYAYSQDVAFPESYEIRISTTTPEIASFLAHPPVATIAAETSELIFRSTSLDAYAGQDIYIAFRQTSADRFALVLDDIRLAEVEQFDIALTRVPEIMADTGDNVFFTGAILNQGLDTVSFDSSQLKIHYQIDSDPVQTFAVIDPFVLLPNDTIQFRHDSVWIPLENKVYRLRLWISGFGTDNDVANDSVGRWVGIGSATGIEADLAPLPFTFFPNPVSDQVTLRYTGTGSADFQVSLLDLTGRSVIPAFQPRKPVQLLSLEHLNAGIYFLRITASDGKAWLEKIVVQ